MSISKEGVFECGAVGQTQGDVLAMFVDTTSGIGGKPSSPFTNAHDFSLRTVHFERPTEFAHAYTRMDRRQNGLSCAIAKAYWMCVTKGYLQGGPATFRELYERTWWTHNACGAPISVLKSCLYCDLRPQDEGPSRYISQLWCPAKRGTSGENLKLFRTFDLSWRNAKATCLIARVDNDGSSAAQVWMDDEMLLDESGLGASIGRRIRLNAVPKSVKLVVNDPTKATCAYVVAAQLGGVLEAANFRENVNGLDNPTDSYDNNPPPMVLHIPPGWSRDNGNAKTNETRPTSQD